MPEPVALGIKVPDSMGTLNNVMGIAQGAQNLQRGNIQLQREQQANQERLALQQFMSKPENFQTNGRVDLDKVNSAIPAIAPMTGSEVMGKLAALSKAQTESLDAKQNLTQSQRRIVAGPLGILGRAGVQDPAAYQKELENLKATNPDNKELHRLIDAQSKIIGMMPAGGHVAKGAVTVAQSLLTPEGQQSLSPQAGLTQTGGEIKETITTPSVGGNAPSVSMTGRAEPLTLPPTTQTVTTSGQPVYLGRQPGSTAPVAAGNPPGLETSATGAATTANADWASTVEAAKTASTDIANLQNIKRFSQSAQTGVGSDRRAFVAGLAGLLGVDYGELTKTNTDLLAKNANMLALAGGDTNLAKTLAESANPNTHMTKEAIQEAANQVMSQRRMALAKQQFLQPHKALNSPDSYSKALTEWNKVADPRIFQWEHMAPEEQAHMKSSMTEKERNEFRSKIKRAIDLGIVK